ncbi:MAG: TonB-dependent receptor [Burkholderiales bacterium]|nr:TonB-dependent receptor [Burkholderiales bacterium]
MLTHPYCKLILLVVLPASGLFLASGAAAQSGAEEDNQPTQLEEVNVVGKRAFDDRFMSNATRLTISRRDIEAMGANSIGDILRQTPGLQVTTTANGGIEIRMRGMGPENTRILIDGVPVSASNRSSQLPLDELPADLIERIEVIRAPTAEFQGAAGGSLNIVLREASAKKETYLWLTDQYVWGKHGPSLFVSQTGPLGAPPPKPAAGGISESSWTYFLSLSAGERNLGSDTRRESSVNTAAPTTANIEDESRLRNSYWILRPRVTGRLGASDRVTFRGVFSASDRDGSVLSNLNGLSNGATVASATQNPWRYNRSHSQGAVDWSHSFKDAKWDTTLQLDYPQSDYRFDRNTETTLAGVATTRTSAYNEDRAERGLIGKTKLAIAAGESVWTMGGEFESRKLDLGSASTQAGVTTPLDLDASTRRTVLWGQDELTIESIKTALTVGLRAQDFSTDVAAAGASTRFDKLSWQPSINTRTALSEDTQYRFNIARISRNPRVWELAPLTEPSFTSNSPTAPDFRGNPDLRPESTITLDTGIERRLAIGGQAGINLFVRQQSDVIRRRLFLVGTRWTEQPDNIGSALVWGVETDIRTNLKWAGLGRDWTLSANVNLLNSRLNGDTLGGERIPGQARYLANLNIAKPLRVSGGWYGGGTLALTGSSDSNFASTPNVLTTGGERAHAQLDMYIGSVVPTLGFWRLNVYNITDFRSDRTRVVTDTLTGTVTTEHSERWLTPRWFLTLGTRF